MDRSPHGDLVARRSKRRLRRSSAVIRAFASTVKTSLMCRIFCESPVWWWFRRFFSTHFFWDYDDTEESLWNRDTGVSKVMGIPQVTMVVSILSHGRITWMIWGTTILGNILMSGWLFGYIIGMITGGFSLKVFLNIHPNGGEDVFFSSTKEAFFFKTYLFHRTDHGNMGLGLPGFAVPWWGMAPRLFPPSPRAMVKLRNPALNGSKIHHEKG